jgi:hypothetical protein
MSIELQEEQEQGEKEPYKAQQTKQTKQTKQTEELQRIPAFLWNSLQEICYRQDIRFIADVSKLIGVPAVELKKKILGVRGIPTTIAVERGPWWSETQCPIMERGNGNMWRRCGNYCESHGQCWAHRHYKSSHTTRRFDDPYFSALPKRRPIRYNGEIVWVSESGEAIDGSGNILKGLTIDLKTHTADESTPPTISTE